MPFYLTNGKTVEYPHEVWDTVSTRAKEALQAMLQYNPANRITAREIFQHPYFQQQTTEESDMTTKQQQTVINMMRSFNAERKLRKVLNTVYAFAVWQRRTFGTSNTSVGSSGKQSLSSLSTGFRSRQTSQESTKDQLEGELNKLSHKLSATNMSRTKSTLLGQSSSKVESMSLTASKASSPGSMRKIVPRQRALTVGTSLNISKENKSGTQRKTSIDDSSKLQVSQLSRSAKQSTESVKNRARSVK